MTPDAHARQLLARLQAVEAETRQAVQAVKFALDDLQTALSTSQQIRAELAAVLHDASGRVV